MRIDCTIGFWRNLWCGPARVVGRRIILIPLEFVSWIQYIIRFPPVPAAAAELAGVTTATRRSSCPCLRSVFSLDVQVDFVPLVKEPKKNANIVSSNV